MQDFDFAQKIYPNLNYFCLNFAQICPNLASPKFA